MKRAKIMLLAIAVIATVGGVLAFKAQKLHKNIYCLTNNVCEKQAFKTVAAGGIGVTTPCITAHGNAAPSSTQYFTTNGCGELVEALATTTTTE